MKEYQTKALRLRGTRYARVYDEAICVYNRVKKRTKRRPYIRSLYFGKQKVFLDLFWAHLHEKNWHDRARRIRFFPAGVELLCNSKVSPITKENKNNKNEILHRFVGRTGDKYLFYVQVREDKRTGNKSLYSIFPAQKENKMGR